MDHNGYLKFYEKYNRALFGRLLRITRHRQDTEDIAQEIWKKVWDFRGSINDPAGSWAFLMSVVRTKFSGHNRHDKSLKRRRKGYEELIRAMGEEAPDPLSSHESEELQKVIKKLGEKDRQIMMLRYLYELTYDEIADVMNIKPGAVKARTNRALTILGPSLSHALWKPSK